MKGVFDRKVNKEIGFSQLYQVESKECVWSISTKPFPEAHFAVFPEELVKQCLDAGCPSKGICLDPFMGSGTMALVALKHNRNFVGIELNRRLYYYSK